MSWSIVHEIRQLERICQFFIDFLKLLNLDDYACVFEVFHWCSTFSSFFFFFSFFVSCRRYSIFRYHKRNVRFNVFWNFIMKVDNNVKVVFDFDSVQSLRRDVVVVVFDSFNEISKTFFLFRFLNRFFVCLSWISWSRLFFIRFFFISRILILSFFDREAKCRRSNVIIMNEKLRTFLSSWSTTRVHTSCRLFFLWRDMISDSCNRKICFDNVWFEIWRLTWSCFLF